MNIDTDRRGFIKGVSLAAMAGGAMAGRAACCGADGGVATAGRALPWLETDVLVVGGGPAAGTAAALCIKTGSTPRTLDAKSLVDVLKAQGAFLG